VPLVAHIEDMHLFPYWLAAWLPAGPGWLRTCCFDVWPADSRSLQAVIFPTAVESRVWEHMRPCISRV